jgi:pimeloyl-ACP methyl ester carboxylesterase
VKTHDHARSLLETNVVHVRDYVHGHGAQSAARWAERCTVDAMKLTRPAIVSRALRGLRTLAARRHRFIYESSGRDPGLPALARRHGYELRELATDGARLQGLLRRPADSAAPLLMFFPGNATPQLATFLPVVERLRAGRDFGVSLFAYRGYDGSSGKPSPADAARDAWAQRRWLERDLGIATGRIALAGYSMGSGIALRLASELCEQHAHAPLLLLSPFWSLPLGPAHALRLLVPTHVYTVEDALPALRGPMLVIAGGRDTALPVELHARRLARALGERAEYRELADATHTDYLDDRAVLEAAGSFIASRARG